MVVIIFLMKILCWFLLFSKIKFETNLNSGMMHHELSKTNSSLSKTPPIVHPTSLLLLNFIGVNLLANLLFLISLPKNLLPMKFRGVVQGAKGCTDGLGFFFNCWIFKEGSVLVVLWRGGSFQGTWWEGVGGGLFGIWMFEC